MQIEIEGLGKRHVIRDCKEIIWFINELCRKRKKAFRTKYILDFKEKYFEMLKEVQAYELLAFISQNIKESQESRREMYRKRAKLIAEKETKRFQTRIEKRKMLSRFVANICLN